MLERYKASGVLTNRFFVGAPIVLIAAGVLGAIYQVLEHYIPIIYVDVMLSVGMGFATGYLVAVLSKSTHCRNRWAGAGLGFAASLLAVAVSHWVEYRMQRPGIIAACAANVRAAVDAQLGFFDYLQLRAEVGWSIGHMGSSSNGSGDFTGIFAYAVWVIEAGLIIGFGVAGGIRGATRPYCEACGAWADYGMLNVTIPEPSPQLIAEVRGAEAPASLVPSASAMIPSAPPPPPSDPKEAKRLAQRPFSVSALRYTVTSCPRCKMFHSLLVQHETVVTQGKKSQKKAVKMHEDVLLSSEDVGRLAQLKG